MSANRGGGGTGGVDLRGVRTACGADRGAYGSCSRTSACREGRARSGECASCIALWRRAALAYRGRAGGTESQGACTAGGGTTPSGDVAGRGTGRLGHPKPVSEELDHARARDACARVPRDGGLGRVPSGMPSAGSGLRGRLVRKAPTQRRVQHARVGVVRRNSDESLRVRGFRRSHMGLGAFGGRHVLGCGGAAMGTTPDRIAGLTTARHGYTYGRAAQCGVRRRAGNFVRRMALLGRLGKSFAAFHHGG